MKKIIYILLSLLIFSCSKSEDESKPDKKESGVLSYHVSVSSNPDSVVTVRMEGDTINYKKHFFNTWEYHRKEGEGYHIEVEGMRKQRSGFDVRVEFKGQILEEYESVEKDAHIVLSGTI